MYDDAHRKHARLLRKFVQALQVCASFAVWESNWVQPMQAPPYEHACDVFETLRD